MKTAVVGFKRENPRWPPTSGLLWILALMLVAAGNARGARAGEPLPVAHWKLATGARDSSSDNLHATNHGVRFSEGAAVFNGKDGPMRSALWIVMALNSAGVVRGRRLVAVSRADRSGAHERAASPSDLE